MPLLFSYGTLQEVDVQVSTFGRRLQGERDELPGYEPGLVPIANPEAAAAIGRTHYANVVFNGRDDSRVSGMVFEVSEAELAAADRYEEPALYQRVSALLASGRRAWVYVAGTTASILWRRLDAPGHDACRLEEGPQGRVLEGVAVFSEDGAPARLAYRVTCDREWRTVRGEVRGWVGARPLHSEVARTSDGAWTLDGRAFRDMHDCVHLDLGFTPATNLFQIRRAGLPVGQSADVPVAWLDPLTGTFQALAQRYERRTETAYWYESPAFGYAELLEVDGVGFVRRYPGLWEAEA